MSIGNKIGNLIEFQIELRENGDFTGDLMKLLSKRQLKIFLFSLVFTSFLCTGNSFGAISVTTNECGIPIVDYGYVHGIFIGKQFNPVTISHRAIYYETEYQKGNESCKQLFLNNANYLVNNAISHGNYTLWQYNFPWPLYKLPNPWISGMAQGEGIKVLTHAYNMTGDEKYLDAAQLTLNSFYIETKDGGVTYKDENGWWYEEYVTGTEVQPRVLNGMIYSLLGIYDYYELTGSQDAKFLFDQGIVSLKNNLYIYDAGNGTFYDALGCKAPISYHTIHVNQMLQLYEITKDPFFREYYEKFQGYTQYYNNTTSKN